MHPARQLCRFPPSSAYKAEQGASLSPRLVGLFALCHCLTTHLLSFSVGPGSFPPLLSFQLVALAALHPSLSVGGASTVPPGNHVCPPLCVLSASGVAGDPRRPKLVAKTRQSLRPLHMASSPYLCLFFPSYKDTSHLGSGPTRMEYGLIVT